MKTTKTKAKSKAKKRNPHDATLRNINSLKRRVAKLEKSVTSLQMVNYIIGRYKKIFRNQCTCTTQNQK